MTFTDIANVTLLLVGVAVCAGVFRFGWAVADGLSKMALAKLWPNKRLTWTHGASDDGKAFRWLNDDFGRVVYIERSPENDSEAHQ